MIRAWACIGWEKTEVIIPTVCIYYKNNVGAETLLHCKLKGKEATPENVEKAFEELSTGVKEGCFQAAPLQERERFFLKRYNKPRPSQ